MFRKNTITIRSLSSKTKRCDDLKFKRSASRPVLHNPITQQPEVKETLKFPYVLTFGNFKAVQNFRRIKAGHFQGVSDLTQSDIKSSHANLEQSLNQSKY